MGWMAMDHAEALERIEIAAAEPGGLERLAAGDTGDASIVAGHLAGCASCADALVRITRTAQVARVVIRELPDPTLRARTLALVREVGRDRSGAADRPAVGTVAGTLAGPREVPAELPAAVDRAPVSSAITPFGGPPARRRPWLAIGLAAAVVVAAVAGFAVGGAARPPAGASEDVANTISVMQTTMRIAARRDVVSIALAPVGSGGAAGTVLYSPAGGELAMLVTGLATVPDGATYACWVESGGTKRRIGTVYAEGGTGSWAGPVAGLDGLLPGSVFGVSLVPAGAQSGTPVLSGG
jgi:hypothetical protein